MGATTHIAIMREPYITRVLAGEKTIESRFSHMRAAPYDRIEPGDRLLLKRAGGPLVAETTVAAVRQYADLTPDRVLALIEEFMDGLRLDADFIARAQARRYAVLIWLGDVRPLLPPHPYAKRDRRGWVVLGRDDTMTR